MDNLGCLSICITSYNRTNELKRCLESVDSKFINEIEIVISEDNSPLRNDISKLVSDFAEKSPYKVIFNSNEKNLGYDNNLAKLISLARAKFIMFMSDDDCFSPGMLDKVINYLKSNDFGVAFVPFYFGEDLMKFSRKYDTGSMKIEKGEASAAKYLYDSILFSGLLFNRNLAKQYSAERFKNLNYFQVYLFLTALYKEGGAYIDFPAVDCVGDGENAYGIAESSGGNNLLSNRKDVFSFPEFHKGLIRSIRYFDEDHGTNVIHHFENEYSIRLYGRLSTARKAGRGQLKEYWKQVTSLNIRLSLIANIYYISLFLFGSEFCDYFYALPRKILYKKRGRRNV